MDRFDLIETLRYDPDIGVFALDRHLARMRASAEVLGFAFDLHDAANELQAACFRLRAPARVRMRLSAGGATAIEVAPPPAMPDNVTVAVVPLPVPPDDPRLRHKTSDRAFYDAARLATGCVEVVFVDPDGCLTEGSFTTLFVPQGDGRLVTPPLARGLLPGVLRAALIDEGRAIEGDLTAADLARPFFLGNALRGLISARLAQAVVAPAKRGL